MNKQELLQALSEVGFCEDVEPAFLEQLATVCKPISFPLGTVIFREGEPAVRMYLIRTGNISLEICAPGVGCRRILTLGAGELLGWSAVLQQTHLTATARTLERTEAIELDAAQVIAMCEHAPRFGYEFMKRSALALAKRLSATRLQLLNVYGVTMPTVPAPHES
jgi:CRP-like cAMP-binding protein